MLQSDNGAGKSLRKAEKGISRIVKCFCERALQWQLSEFVRKEIMKVTKKAAL